MQHFKEAISLCINIIVLVERFKRFSGILIDKVSELQVNEGDWVADKKLSESRLTSEGVLVLGIHRKSGAYLGSPDGRTKIVADDVLTVYGPIDRLRGLEVELTDFLINRLMDRRLMLEKGLRRPANRLGNVVVQVAISHMAEIDDPGVGDNVQHRLVGNLDEFGNAAHRHGNIVLD